MTEWLADTLLATTLLMLAVLALRAPVARLFGARIAYALWLIPAARLFMPSLTRTVQVAAPPPGDFGLSPETVAWLASREPAGPDWTLALVTAWLGGAVLLLLWRMAAYLAERDDILELARPVARYGSVELVETRAVDGPIAFGLLRRFVAVPPSFFRTFEARERELILAHELSHHRAGDLALNLAAFGMLCLHWFNPVAWAAWRAFRFDQEAACDARVLAAAEPCDRAVYGRAVAKAASGKPLLFASALDRTNSLKKRLRTMKTNDKSRRRRFAGLLIIGGALAAALPLTATVNTAVAYVQDADTDTGLTPPPAPPTREPAPAAPAAPAAPEPPAADAGERHVFVQRFDGEEGEEVRRRHVRRIVHTSDIPSAAEIEAMIPEIDIEQSCPPDGRDAHVQESVTANGRQRIRIMICGEELAREARQEAIEGMREAMAEIERDSDIPAELREQVLSDLRRSVERLSRAGN